MEYSSLRVVIFLASDSNMILVCLSSPTNKTTLKPADQHDTSVLAHLKSSSLARPYMARFATGKPGKPG